MLQILKYCDMNSLSATRDICHMGRGRSQIPLIDSNYHFLLEGTQTTISGSARMMNMDSNVAAMKGWLMEKVEADWNSAARENADSNLDLDAERSLGSKRVMRWARKVVTRCPHMFLDMLEAWPPPSFPLMSSLRWFGVPTFEKIEFTFNVWVRSIGTTCSRRIRLNLLMAITNMMFGIIIPYANTSIWCDMQCLSAFHLWICGVKIRVTANVRACNLPRCGPKRHAKLKTVVNITFLGMFFLM